MKTKLTRARNVGEESKSERSMSSGGVIGVPTGCIGFRGNWKEMFNDWRGITQREQKDEG